MLENIIKKIKHISLVGLTAIALNCDNGTSNSVRCNTNSDCATGLSCTANENCILN